MDGQELAIKRADKLIISRQTEILIIGSLLLIKENWHFIDFWDICHFLQIEIVVAETFHRTLRIMNVGAAFYKCVVNIYYPWIL